ncbi:MAG: cytochrome c-type biogenesis CcmF C-terminal domain-containing protein [Solirubrobacteraceae bacterium]|nr:cytochrome c-type biogenesis CcmF C-terminal domain-containing protein [Patulibacter sp.]
MDVVGRALLILAFAVSIFGCGSALASARGLGPSTLIVTARRSLYAVMALAVTAFVLLEIAFIRPDFHYTVVVGHASLTTPLLYRIAAPWASQEGSLLLWLTLLSLTSTISIRTLRGRMRDVEPYAIGVMLLLAAFFAGLLVFAAKPFTTSAIAPADGLGLSPLLRYPTMMIHPPLLYSGYTLFTVPFAFAIGALAAGRVGTDWIVHTRRYALIAWLLLGTGIILGSRWSYAELGWGGYWAWDPVENASLLPWMTATAFLHTIIVQERRGLLKTWNASLVLATGLLCLLGTFLVRSGVLSSIHAFGESTVGPPFLGLIGGLTFLCIWLVMSRRQLLEPDGELRWLSRESMFLLGNLALIVLVVVVLWGTFFPLISEALTGSSSSVGTGWFSTYATPSALSIVALSGLAPLLPWGRGRWGAFGKAAIVPLAGGVVVAVLTVAMAGTHSVAAILMALVCGFTLIAVGREFWIGARARRALTGDAPPLALVRAAAGNRRRYGGYLVHAGLAMLLLAVAASTAFDTTKQQSMVPGQTIDLAGGRQLKYLKPTGDIKLNKAGRIEYISFGAEMQVIRNGKPAEIIDPRHDFYPSLAIVAYGPVGRFFQGEESSEVSLRSRPARDLWVAMTPDSDGIVTRAKQVDAGFQKISQNLDENVASALLAKSLQGIVDQQLSSKGAIVVRAIDSPGVLWVWIGAVMMILGGLLAISQPSVARSRVKAAALARVGKELQQV